MSTELTIAEIDLVRAYQSAPEANGKASIIRRYAEFMNLSQGRAEDQLELWAYMLHAIRARNHSDEHPTAFTVGS